MACAGWMKRMNVMSTKSAGERRVIDSRKMFLAVADVSIDDDEQASGLADVEKSPSTLSTTVLTKETSFVGTSLIVMNLALGDLPPHPSPDFDVDFCFCYF